MAPIGRIMSAKIKRLWTKKQRLNASQAAQLEQMLLQFSEDLNVPYETINPVIAATQRAQQSQSDWTFVMLSPQQNAEVVQYLRANSKRPMQAMELWAMLFTAMRTDTGEICITRDELAETLDTTPNHISRIMTELSEINAIVRRKEGRRVRYFMNPNVATNLTGAERDAAQKKEGQISIFDVIEGGKR